MPGEAGNITHIRVYRQPHKGIFLWINDRMLRINEIVTENLKRWMAASETLKTQEALARAAKVGQSHISRILRGEANPTVTILESIARAFKRKPIDLLSDSGKEYPAAPQSESPTAQEPPPDERELLRGYRVASAEVREIMLEAARRATRKQDSSRQA